MPSNFRRKSLKIKKSGTHKVTHKIEVVRRSNPHNLAKVL